MINTASESRGIIGSLGLAQLPKGETCDGGAKTKEEGDQSFV
ncbi:hypothetical protein SynROS8604_02463 [Synechococcus sp. ROS8604]|nr:hypothetical protein SynROS8604_02463 [Synechococcus sp. ROS8604]